MSQTFEPQILDHPLIQHKISLMRKKETGSKDFRELASEVATLMCYEATRDLPLKEVTVETPICRCKTKMIAGRKLAIVPILRAGLGMVDGMLTLIPAAKVGHIGLYRDEETAKRHRCRFHDQKARRRQHQVYVHHRRPGGPCGLWKSTPRCQGVCRRAG